MDHSTFLLEWENADLKDKLDVAITAMDAAVGFEDLYQAQSVLVKALKLIVEIKTIH